MSNPNFAFKCFTFTNRCTYLLILESTKIYIKIHTKCSYMFRSVTLIIIIYVMELGHLLTRAGLTYPEVSSKVRHTSFCQLKNSVSLPWVIYYEAFYLCCIHFLLYSSNLSKIGVIFNSFVICVFVL